MSTTVLTINLESLTHNYNYLRSKISNNVKMLGVVKAFAYGSEAIAIANHLQNLGIDYFGVAYAEEGVNLRKNGITQPILVLHPQPDNFQLIIDYNLEPGIYNLRTLNLFSEAVSRSQAETHPIHIKYNSGLNRLGFKFEDISEIITILNNSGLTVTGIFSHLAASEDLNEEDFTQQQIEKFKKFFKSFETHLENKPIIHQCNTSGILNYPEAHFNMVRTGIGLYGYGNDARYDKNLKPVASLTSVISQIHELQIGESLGYNRGFIAEKLTRTATIALGHADGIGRIYGHSKGFVIIKGKKAPILGNVCMDMIMVDVTKIDCKEGDEVIIFSNEFTANELAEAAGTISYELITGIGARVKRKIINS